MKLSNDLISQFVKTTADNDTTKKETTVYGTVVKQGSNVFVKLDGSELLTPASSTTVVKNGERVTVMIKNHTAVITGNISSPAAQDNDVKEVGSKISEFEIIIAGKVSTTEFEAEKARINSVVADNVLIKNKLTANDATIGKLETDYLAVNGKLTAVEGDISILRTKKLDAEIATITYATIANLEATNIKVNNLESTYGDFKDLVTEKLRASEAEITDLKAKKLDVESADLLYAKIGDFTAISGKVDFMEVGLEKVNTLISGNVTAGSTDTIVLNASNTTIENALIKSAMVESLTFDKITGIDINTTKLTVHSNDGKSKWMDNTIQISDSKRIRVQIGKDASGDYNMYVWDAAGKLMFDATGITSSGIQRPIIVDSMVADNANIAGDKINITSLVKEINDGVETIKSSHILVDGVNQSLSVVYNTITGDISKLSTNLSVEQGKISSLITDVSQAKGDVSTLQTNYSSLTQTVSGINSTVSSHTSSIENLNNMEIGGVNLLVIKTAIKGKYLNKNGEEVIEGGWFYSDYISVSELKNLTTSGYSNLGNSPSVCYYDSSKNFIKGINNNGQSKAQHIAIESGIAYIRFSGMIKDISTLKIEKGTKATSYSPAPEDVDASIKTVSDKTSVLEQTINGFDARITSATSTAGNALTKATELSATVDGYNVRISKAETNASTALSRTNTLEQKVTATSLITTIASGISGGTALSTTKFVMDASGLHIKNGGFDISNNAGTKVFNADTAGNLSITASMNAASGKIGKFTLNDGLIYEGQSTYKGMSGQVTEKYYFNISPNSAHKDVGNIERNFVSSWTLPLLKVNTSGENSFEVYPDGFLQSRQIKLGDGVVEGTLYFGSSQYSNSAFINSGGNIWAAGNVQAKNFVAANGQGLRVLNSSGVPTTLIYTDSSGNARIPNNNFIVSKAMTVNGSLHAKAASWIGSNYSTGGWIGIYDSYGGTRKGYIGYGTATETQFNIYNNEGAHNGVALDATANGNWIHGRFIPLYGGMALGSSSNRWYRLYSSVGCDTSSDIRLKNSIRGYDERYEAMYMDMQPVTFELNAVPGQRQGGLIAQWTKDAMTKYGITDSEFGAYNYHPEDDTYGIIYEQLTSLNMHMIQKTIKRMDKHDEEISKLKQENEELKAKLNAYIKGELEVRTCLL